MSVLATRSTMYYLPTSAAVLGGSRTYVDYAITYLLSIYIGLYPMHFTAFEYRTYLFHHGTAPGAADHTKLIILPSVLTIEKECTG